MYVSLELKVYKLYFGFMFARKFANWVQFANGTKFRERDNIFANMTFMFANGQRSRMGRNIYTAMMKFVGGREAS